MSFVIGTAGHIDHGKTSLVKALTGQDTDRLKEEKERGISIDLGFAYLDLPDGTRAGIVDVPGHERFIRNMLAGAHGIDLVLLTVAADDGVMPQTEEHLDIIHLLGVRHAIVVITKVDLATPERLRAVEEEIEILIAGTSIDRSPMLYCSTVTGDGIEALRAEIVRSLARIEKPPSGGYFRLPIDRSFTLQGHGLVVTGTVLDGTVHVGNRVRCLPDAQLFRVRGLQVHNAPAERGTRGQRLALNLVGPDTTSVVRGDVLCHEHLSEPSARFDAHLEAASASTVRLKSHQRVRVHLGTAARMGKLVLLGRKETLRTKQSAYGQLELTEPLFTMRGDRFILRDETGQRTIGGGIVVNPWARKHGKREPDLLRVLGALHHGTVQESVEALVNSSPDFALRSRDLSLFLNAREDQVRGEIARIKSIRCLTHEADVFWATSVKWQLAQQSLLGVLAEFHREQPLAEGMDLEAARGKLTGFGDPLLFRLFLDQVARDGVVVRSASVLRLPTHKVVVSGADMTLMDRVIELLRATPLSPPDLKQIEQQSGALRPKLLEVVKVLERNKRIVRVAADLYFQSEALDQLVLTLRQRLAVNANITPADFRDLFSTSRKYAIPLLEYLDRQGITVRVGDARRLREQRS
jgi:selenocysteine-specific elongation factor